jgi:hypothetical protein
LPKRAEESVEKVRALARGEYGELHIGYAPSPTVEILPPALAAFQNFAVARFASARVATFVVSLLAVQCVLNALLDLKTVFFLSSPFAATVPTDAVNMANATGVPAFVWASLWIAISVLILVVALKQYVASRRRSFAGMSDLGLEQGSPMWSIPGLPSTSDQVRYDKSV